VMRVNMNPLGNDSGMNDYLEKQMREDPFMNPTINGFHWIMRESE
jgi:hypothetical protein